MSDNWIKSFLKSDHLTALMLRKIYVVARFYPGSALRKPMDTLRYLLSDPESTNFTYEISNREELCATVAEALGVTAERVAHFADELTNDVEFQRGLSARLSTRRHRKSVPLFGRRIGWYCIVRLLRPRLVIETGVFDGLGSALLLRALNRNRAEGAPGRLIAIDIDATSGWLIEPDHESYDLVIENSLTSLPRLLAGNELDFFIHDSNHVYQHEAREYEIVTPFLSPGAVLVSDNAHCCTALADYSAAVGRQYFLYRERPLRHFYPGAGMGISVAQPRSAT